MKRRSSFLLAILLAALSGCHTDHQEFVAPQPEPQDPLETIARYEDARTDGDGLLQTLLQKGDTRTRERAAVALGRLDPTEFGAEVTDGLVVGLGDESGSVRAAAAFGLGERADATSAGALLAHWHDPDPNVRARIVEAGSRIDDARLRTAVLASIDDADARVRNEAAIGISRFPAGSTDARNAESVLVDYLSRPTSGPKPAPDGETLWRGFFTFSRNKAQRSGGLADRIRELCIQGLSSKDVRARIFAAKSLADLSPDDTGAAALLHAIEDPDWRVACEAAIALGKYRFPVCLGGLERAAGHACAHVRRAAVSAYGAFTPPDYVDSAIEADLERARADSSAEVRAAALESEVSVLGSRALRSVREAAKSKDPLERAAAASAAARLHSAEAVALLIDLTHDSNLRVTGIAIEGLQKEAGPAAHARSIELLSNPDNGLRLAAVTSLDKGKMLTAADVPALRTCMESSSGEISGELAAAIVDAANSLGKDGRPILQLALTHPDPYVRKKAVALMTWSDGGPPAQAKRVPASTNPDLSRPATNPRVEVVTNRGTMVFELFPSEAPNHVRNLLELAARHHYDGLSFHRVELDFVIQGGDHRGDGNGGVTWNDAPLRAEFTPRKFVRGSLGMPRNDDPDSGGSQFFVTHRDTPHLDGRYTNFGLLVSGFDTLDAIEVGDTIESVRVVPAQ